MSSVHCTVAYTGKVTFYKVREKTAMFIWSHCILNLLYFVLCFAQELLAGGQQHLLVLALDLHLHQSIRARYFKRLRDCDQS